MSIVFCYCSPSNIRIVDSHCLSSILKWQLLQFLGGDRKIAFVFQVVWKGTKKVGVGIATTSSPNGDGYYESYVVARYSPPGNYEGEFKSNVGEEL